MTRGTLLLMIAGLLASAGCGKPRGTREKEAALNLAKANSFVAEFQSVFPATIGYFTHYEDSYGPTTWHSRVGLHGRYVLEMRIEVGLGPDRTRIQDSKAPAFTLLQVKSLSKQADGSISVKYEGSAQVDFGPVEWKALVERKGDLSAIGVSVGSDPPFPDFEQVWKEF